MNTDGWCPFATPRPFPAANFTVGYRSRKAVCMHIMDGGFEGSITWMRSQGTSSHFGISKRGDLVQLVSVLDSAHGNGLSFRGGRWLCPHQNTVVRPAWKLIEPPINPNLETISIEREGRPNDKPTDAMEQTTVRLLRWLAEVFGFVYVPGESLIGHRDLDLAHRAHCPGPHVDLAALARAVNEPDWSKLWHPYPYVTGHGFPDKYRELHLAGRRLGRPQTDEQELVPGSVFQVFEAGVLRYDKDGGRVRVFTEDG